jgi:nickel/cobalt transporter (NicO) family protein
MRSVAPLIIIMGLVVSARAHDIPNARVDRSIQLTLAPGELRVDYEVSLSELTLLQDLKQLVGAVPSDDRSALFDRYGRETSPLNAKGLLVWVDGDEVLLQPRHFDLAIEEHPRFTFHFSTALPSHGRLKVRDTNYVASEGTSRLAVRGLTGTKVDGDALPSNVEDIPIRPVWQLSDLEEKRTKGVEIAFSGSAETPERSGTDTRSTAPSSLKKTNLPALSRLLDRAFGLPWALTCLLAVALGAAHAIQPGHGKTLVAATVVSTRGSAWQGAVLALITTLTHMSSVLAIAGTLYLTHTTRYTEINTLLARSAGFVIAAIGLWRLGRHLGGYAEHDLEGVGTSPGGRGLVGLGVAGGLVPCWDAVVLILVADLMGKLAVGVLLLAAFSLGMGFVLVLVGVLSSRLSKVLAQRDVLGGWERGLGVAGASILTAIGLYLLSGT